MSTLRPASRIAGSTAFLPRSNSGFGSQAHTPHVPLASSPCRPRMVPKRQQKASTCGTRRTFFTDALPTVLVPPAVFLACFTGLWSYKIFMTIVFQNKLIYMPYMPPFARSEKIADYENACKPVVWQEKRVKSLDGTDIALCVGSVPQDESKIVAPDGQKRGRVVVIYFQGNGASLPPRLPALSGVLKTLRGNANADAPDYSIVALSYRGFWTSRGRASQKGIELDARAALAWVQKNYSDRTADPRIVLWGQSLGAGVAANVAAWHLESPQASETSERKPEINSIILETPFVGIKEMLLALYPQKWLPYRYLWPFLRNWWDNDAALRSIAAAKGSKHMPILIIAAGRDEVVPQGQADHLHALCQSLRLDVRRKDVLRALHNDVPSKPEGRGIIASFVSEVGR